MDVVTVDVSFEERYWYPDDGAIVWLAGYQLVDPITGAFVARDAAVLADAGLRVAGVAGAARHHAEALQSQEAAPGSTLALRRDAANAHDPNAIAVHVAGGEQIGWVPRSLAEELAPALDDGVAWSAIALRERRASPREPRDGLTMLLARASAIELKVHDRRPPRRS
ncbi:MAG: HIRAN domain-containing protein [Solirubrobacteraceae bacterium]